MKKKNIKKLLKILLKNKILSEIIFVDDNSNDETYSELVKITKHLKKIKIILSKYFSRDLSKSVMLGVKAAKNELIVVLDADLQHRPMYVNYMYKMLKKKN